VMATAILRLWPDAQFAAGPPVEDGFYYDLEMKHRISPDDFAKIEEEMKKEIKANNTFERIEVGREEAQRDAKSGRLGGLAERPNNPSKFKLDLIQQIPEGEKISYYKNGDFIDLCAGPHVMRTGNIGAFKLMSVAAAYYKGDEKGPQLQRIYGTAWFNKKDQDEYLTRLEEAKKRDHRKLGQELDLFSIQDTIGPGLILWHPKGAAIRQQIEAFWKTLHEEHGYQFVYTPHVARLDLWRTSGHVDFYRENMFPPMEIEGAEYELKPMNCPFHLLIYQSHLRSYRELPIRFAELGTVYRYERSGVLHGLMRVRGFTQDDAHIFCRADQVEEEISRVLELTTTLLGAFGFHEYDIYLSTRPAHYVGTLEHWEAATTALSAALTRRKLAYQIDPGEGVFYGPKIDIKVKDHFGRAWQCATVQVDFNLPERFGLAYRGEDSREHAPIMIHRALMGSLERFFGILIEHYGGAFPTWLAPVQAVVIPIGEAHAGYAELVEGRLRSRQIRVEVDRRNEKMGLKIRDAQLQKVPYMIIVGGREQEQHTVSLRLRSGEQIAALNVDELVDRLTREIAERRSSTP